MKYRERVICFGGRKYRDDLFLANALAEFRAIYGPFVLIHGDAPGADRLSGEWGKTNGMPVIVVPANWDFYSTQAGPIRNEWMADLTAPTYGIKFPGGAGTNDMRNKLLARGIPVWNPADMKIPPLSRGTQK
jgi:hypothetical protein